MEYNFRQIEDKWRKYWADKQIFRADNKSNKPKYYVLDMFPYPSGAGLHVGHPLGYIASDIYSRYKRHKGFNVLHPMGYDSFGLPAEQYAIQTGQHPAVTTKENIQRYREQLDQIGFSFDWSREVRTSDPSYYKWTQWIFCKFFGSWYDKKEGKARPVTELISIFEKNGNAGIDAAADASATFTAAEWKAFSEIEKYKLLLNYRLAYLSDTWVNWCPALGTVLANEEVKDGVSERGGHPVERKLMKQWFLRIGAYADRLLYDLEKIDWPESIKEQQRNWIGRSEGARVFFSLDGRKEKIEVFTTRPDTIFGVTFLTLAPEHELVDVITAPELRQKVGEYVTQAKARSERERQADVSRITGVFSGAYAVHPFSGERIPVWIGDYVLAGYGTGAVMAVPAHDTRDYAFARHFNIPVKEVVKGGNIAQEAYEAKEGEIINSDFLNGLQVKNAIKTAIERIAEKGIGEKKVNYRLRDAIFSRQRYWGEPIPVYFKDGLPYLLDESKLPLELPEVDKYLPTESGEPPLARAKNFATAEGYPYEASTMPGWAGSSWYYLRYMDAGNNNEFASNEALDYWKQVDLYIGGAEHATGHLLYVRFWTKFLNDLGYISINEPAQKLINQGMIQGRSNFVYRVQGKNQFVSFGLRDNYNVTPIHVDVNIVRNDVLDIEAFRNWRQEFADAEFILEDGKYICGNEVEKMSKSKWNVVNPDDIIRQYGADTLRLYEMFLGPLEQSKPWNTNGIEGVHRFLKKLWKLYINEKGELKITGNEPSKEELKVLHKTIRKVTEDIDRFSFNTSVSNFMICVNELTDLRATSKVILEPLLILISPYAPHIAEELWSSIGHKESISYAPFPVFDEKHLVESTFAYPVSFNGKTRFNLELPIDMPSPEIEKEVLNNEQARKWLEGKSPKKVIIVPRKIINVVV